MKYCDIIKTLVIEAQKSELSFKHAALLMLNNKIVSIGYNHYVSYQKDKQKRWAIHAEVDCLVKLSRKLRPRCNEMKMYVIRVNKSGHLLLSKPCCKCNDLIEKYNVKKVFYSI
jgi:deoxycytidylate deaminase